MDGGTSVSKSQSSNFIITFDECNHPGIISNLFIYLFIHLFTRLPPPTSCNVNSIRRCLSWPPDNNDTKFHKTVAGGPTSWIYTYPICLWLCCCGCCCCWSFFLCLSSFFLLYYVFNLSVLLVVVFDVVVLAYWFYFYFKNLFITSYSILAMLLGFDLNIIVKDNKKVPPPA